MTYEVKAFNSNATREPVVRVTSKSRPQRIEGETRTGRASIDTKKKCFYCLQEEQFSKEIFSVDELC